ncbi:MAG: ATP-binding cassette domain-containing protein [Dehalococcoidia bacterium]|nr:ATP-binding cassette domain-containing protein [Dehalococcoidia bacterium]
MTRVAVFETLDLTKRYPAVNALDELTISVEPGVVGLVGANGAGKSTLIKLLLGLIEPSAGSASVLGYDVRTQGRELRQFVGYMPEHDCLPLDMNATEFVAHMAQISGLPRSAARERTAEILRHAGLFEERYRAMSGYSTGMRQRAKLAQALVHDPSIVFLDEPTNGLDPAGRDEMLDLIERTGRGMGISILMATHLLGEIERVCDHLIVIDAGQLRHHGPLGGFTGATQTLDVEVTGDAEALAVHLERRGVASVVDGHHVLVSIESEPPFDLIRDTVAELGVGLVRLEQRRHTLEDLFRVQGVPQEVAEGAPEREGAPANV